MKSHHPHYQILKDAGFHDCVDYLENCKNGKSGIPSSRWYAALEILKSMPYGSTLKESIEHKARITDKGLI